MVQVFDNEFFSNMDRSDIKKWVEENHDNLIGSAIFTNNHSITSKVVRWAESWTCKTKGFIPSHTGSIVEKDGVIYSFDMKPLKARVTPLVDYLCNTKDTYRLVLRNFKLDTFMFSQNIFEHVGQWYPYMSAVSSVFTKRESKWNTHCSELHARELQKQNLYLSVNPEITPDELWHIMVPQN